MIYVTQQVERLDMVCWRHYGHLRGTVEAVLNNPRNTILRGLNIARVPAGIAIELPASPEVALPPRVF